MFRGGAPFAGADQSSCEGPPTQQQFMHETPREVFSKKSNFSSRRGRTVTGGSILHPTGPGDGGVRHDNGLPSKNYCFLHNGLPSCELKEGYRKTLWPLATALGQRFARAQDEAPHNNTKPHIQFFSKPHIQLFSKGAVSHDYRQVERGQLEVSRTRNVPGVLTSKSYYPWST